MNPISSQTSISSQTASNSMTSPPATITLTSTRYSNANRRSTDGGTHWAYPWLLCGSTLVAAIFCFLYITKPVILASSPPLSKITLEKPELPVITKPTPTLHADLLPKSDHFPGDSVSNHSPLAIPNGLIAQKMSHNGFEETNLRIQHILTAETPAGNIARIDIEVPVLYESRNLRWTTTDAQEARSLLVRLANFQEKSRMLRAEGIQILDSWNQLVEHSMPASELRADSPSLLINQKYSEKTPCPPGLKTMDSIQIQPTEK
jgi:hypothetical protein